MRARYIEQPRVGDTVTVTITGTVVAALPEMTVVAGADGIELEIPHTTAVHEILRGAGPRSPAVASRLPGQAARGGEPESTLIS